MVDERRRRRRKLGLIIEKKYNQPLGAALYHYFII